MDERKRNEAVARAVEFFGNSQRAMGAALGGIAQSVVSEWLVGDRPVPEQRCAQIEYLSGAAVTCEELLPSHKWVRVRDRTWPHKAGRPLVDVAAMAVSREAP